MAKFLIILSVLLAVVIVASNPIQFSNSVQIQVVTSNEMLNMLEEYPNAVEVEPNSVEKVENTPNKPYTQIEYTFGKRDAGDTHVASTSQSNSYGSPQNAEATISYPSRGEGSILTFVSIIVKQSTLNGKLWIVSGGIGQRHIKIVLETYETTIFDQDANFYGY